MKIPFALRLILAPLAIPYGLITTMRNFLFDIQILKQHSFPFPIISVGNLSTGGTGKSPMVIQVIRLLNQRKKVMVLSRGYGRKTKGFWEVTPASTGLEVGDEALQLKLRFPELGVFVCESRVEGIQRIQGLKPFDVLLLDDAYQHRYVKPGLSLLLTPASQPYSRDFLLPLGNLRELRSGIRRAQAIVVTKIDEHQPYSLEEWKMMLRVAPNQELFLSRMQYSAPSLPLQNSNAVPSKSIVLITGIAHPESYVQYLQNHFDIAQHYAYADHAIFTEKNLETWLREHPDALFWTTEKDWMRLKNIWPKGHTNIGYTPIETDIFAGTSDFEEMIKKYVG
jgi:tetraacyldisaccharide 4'-kinase